MSGFLVDGEVGSVPNNVALTIICAKEGRKKKEGRHAYIFQHALM
jgi:hypothetical protein